MRATEMVERMERNPRRTGGEASEVGNGIFDGRDGMMVCGERGGGRYGVEGVERMDKIV
ncbi:pyruvate kinase [Bacillus altitudinis]|uniref:pyruvate kinase n=1 Tax=Bacillus altitudinis TaxID=293387 RepID=UPI003B525E1F